MNFITLKLLSVCTDTVFQLVYPFGSCATGWEPLAQITLHWLRWLHSVRTLSVL